MIRARTFAVLLVSCAALAVSAAAASAATPRQIYNDYVQHGHLTHHYSQADLHRAMASTLMMGYGHGHHGMQVPPPPPPPTTCPNCEPAPPPQGLPFTGLDLGLITVGALMLLALGGGLRRFARAKA
jgi:hypothetical protein